ncbi:helix-turn-helix domain-containing protein [Levilactobacillus brevis]|uniref:helix-turn-helix domain-containing protein n=1 Tax=Levilactobacillus brevis TaxID=1580 RepID=UPI000406D1A2|nr:helix-turn-helix domain-containing protein [Levilactobacillus brevis]ATU70642.1 helix-turn-helix domain-containing protein [Levilactobacillus brevis]
MELKYLSYKQAMKYLGVKSYNTLYRMIDNGLPVIEVGKVKRIDRDKLDAFLSDKTVVSGHD